MRNSFFLSILLWSFQAASADTTSTNQPTMIQINSKSATFQFKTNALTFSGGVTVHDPDVVMTCQTLVASFANKQKETEPKEPKESNATKTVQLTSGENIDQIEAIGQVKLKVLTEEHKGTTGRCDRAIYTAADRKITMLGNRPSIKQPNGRTTTANRIVYSIETGAVDLDGDVEVLVERPMFDITTRPPAK
ncbi:MAG: LptA/OstA family protein [Limisphaerales bacterium]